MKEFLEKRWWQGVGGIAGIIALVFVVLQFLGIVNISGLGVSIALNIMLAIALALIGIWATRWKRKYENASSRLEKSEGLLMKWMKKSERQRVLLPDKDEMWRLNIDNALLTQLYGQAHGLATTRFHDAKLCGLDIIVYPYDPLDRVSIMFSFYSRWADRKCTYILGETRDMTESQPSKPAKCEEDRVTFHELPWVKDLDWSQFIRKSCEKVGPLSPARWTGYHISTAAWLELQWSISFKGGVTGKESDFSWDGKGEPISENRGEEF